jgi:hypothetical protein
MKVQFWRLQAAISPATCMHAAMQTTLVTFEPFDNPPLSPGDSSSPPYTMPFTPGVHPRASIKIETMAYAITQ